MQGLFEQLVKKTTMSLLDTGETGEKEQLRGLGRKGNFLLQQFEQALPTGNAQWVTSWPPGSKWVVGLSIVLALVVCLVGVMYYIYRCGCAAADDQNENTPTGV